MPSEVYRSPAKLNLFLEVLQRRRDGYHELETVMMRTGLCDLIRIEASDDAATTLRVSGNSELIQSVPTDDSNLILRAVRAFQTATKLSTNWVIELDKQIPMEAGLAGGSSNAATTLRALNELSGTPLSKSRLHAIASTLGSDINFFLADCPAAVCSGRGEVISPFPIEHQFHFVVARPPDGNSTPAVFRRLNLATQPRKSSPTVHALTAGSASKLECSTYNRLTAAASELNPQMAKLLKDLTRVCDRPAAMSGSGSTCFVCCRDQADAEDTLEQVRTLKPHFATVVCSE